MLDDTEKAPRAGGAFSELPLHDGAGNSDFKLPQSGPQVNSRAVREARRQLLRECAGGIRIHVELVQTFAEIGDTAGVCYASRRLFAHVKAAHHGGAEASLLALYGAHIGGSQP